MTWVLLVIALLVGVVFVVGFNRLRAQDVAVQEALGGIDVELTRRAELIPSLVSTVKGYAAHEQSVLEEVTAARVGVERATGQAAIAPRASAEGRLDKAIVNVLAVAESYPELRASTSFVHLQEQLSDAESQLAGARQSYNQAVRRVNTTSATIPWMLVKGAAGVRTHEFYEAPDAQAAPPTVQF